MHIEKAAAADLSALSDLLLLLFSQEAEFTPNIQAHQKGLAKIIHNPEIGVVLLARQKSGQVIGMVNLLFTVSTALGERVALLEDMIVSPAYRHSGVGTKIISEAIVLAQSQNCKRITLLTDLNNKSAQQFYANHGFVVSDMLPMRLMLD